MRKVIAILFSVLFLNGVAQAGMGISVMGGQLSTSGTASSTQKPSENKTAPQLFSTSIYPTG